MVLRIGNHAFDSERRPLVMGVLNVTPDSFWDGGRYASADQAIRRAYEMIGDGADVIDVGGESARPGAQETDAAIEIERITPVVKELVSNAGVPVSIDTRKAAVAERMLEIGAHMINDISGLTFDTGMLGVVAQRKVLVVIMHMRGTPDNMQDMTDYDDVVDDVKRELAERVHQAEAAGIDPERIIIDPGIGFAKTADQCVEIIARLDEFGELGKPILLGASRKSFMGKILDLGPAERLDPTIACCIWGAIKGAAILRVHDVASVNSALRMITEITSRVGPRRAKV